MRALLCVWADRRVRRCLRCTLRNKAIFQEMARQMNRKFGVVRNWKQCRTKYKNLKYDYKVAKGAHATGGGDGPGGPGRYMKFFDEVEAILMDDGEEDDEGGGASESEVVIEIDDGRSPWGRGGREGEVTLSPLRFQKATARTRRGGGNIVKTPPTLPTRPSRTPRTPPSARSPRPTLGATGATARCGR